MQTCGVIWKENKFIFKVKDTLTYACNRNMSFKFLLQFFGFVLCLVFFKPTSHLTNLSPVYVLIKDIILMGDKTTAE